MSRWLARLGRICAQRARTVIVIWITLLLAAGAAALTLSQGTTASYSVPDSEYEEVLDRLGEQIPEYQGGSALVVLSTEEGEAFTGAQQEAIADLSSELESLELVTEVTDPFAQQQELDDAGQDIQDGWTELDEVAQELDEAETEISEAQEEIDLGRQEVAEGREDAELLRQQVGEAPAVLEAEAELDTIEGELDQAQDELDESGLKVEEGWEEHAEGTAELERAERQDALTETMRVVSDSGDVALLNLQLAEEPFNLSTDQQQQIITAVEKHLPSRVIADYQLELVQDVSTILGASETAGLVIAGIVLFITLGTLVAAGLPVLLALIGVGTGVAIIFASTLVVDMTDTDPILALMLGLSLGIDYTLLLIYRHRAQLARGMGITDSLALASGTAGSAIFFAGVTNVIALGALVVTGIPFLAVMGFATSATIIIVVAAVLTLGPALLKLLGERAMPKKLRSGESDEEGAPKLTPAQSAPDPARFERLPQAMQEQLLDRRWGKFITRRPWLAIIAPLLLLGTLAVPAADLRLGLPDGASEPADSTAYATYETVRDEFGPGENGPLLAVLDFPDGLDEAEREETALSLAEDLAGREGIERAVPAGSDESGSLQVLQVTPIFGPNDEQTSELVTELMNQTETLAASYGLEELGFTGQTVANIEISDRLLEVIPLYVGIVVVLCLVLLLAIFRSLLAPLLAAAGYVLSLAASLGAVVAIYQWGWLGELFEVNETGPILAFLPILMCGVLFGLAVDYQLFIMSGVREAHVRGSNARLSILRGLKQGGTVVLACGIIMVSVFAGFIFAELTVIRPIGFGLAIGVLLEALVVRATLIPAATYLLKEKAWYLPRWLDKLLPDVDVEGQKLLNEKDQPRQECEGEGQNPVENYTESVQGASR